MDVRVSEPLAAICAMTVATILTINGSVRTVSPASAVDALRRGLRLPQVAAFTAAVVTALIELVAGVAIAAGVTGLAEPAWAPAGLGLATGLGVIYCAYVAFLFNATSRTPCGCDTSGDAVSGWTLLRTASLPILAAIAWTGSPQSGWTPHDPVELVTASLVVTAISLLIWTLPAAMSTGTAEGQP